MNNKQIASEFYAVVAWNSFHKLRMPSAYYRRYYHLNAKDIYEKYRNNNKG